MATQKEVILKDNTINSVTDIENNGKKEEDPQSEVEKEPIENPDDECHKSVPDQEEVKPTINNVPDVVKLIEVFHFPCNHTTTKLPRGWRKSQSCPECGREYSLAGEEKGKTSIVLNTTTTVVYTFEEK